MFMKPIQKVKGNFQRLNDQDFLALAQTIHLAMLDNIFFENPSPSLESLDQSIMNFTGKLALSDRKGSPYDTAIKNEARLSLAMLIKELAFYVNLVAKGRLSVLLSSGITLASSNTKVLSPTKVKGVQLKDGRQKEQMVLSFDAQDNIRVYKYRFTENKADTGELLWTGEEFSTTSSLNNLIAGVKSASTYYISVQAINSAGTGDWSEPIEWIVR